jgi:D-3-phosphoglycerate dehydrogenase / 2-oxoglutarate reductase
MLTLQNKSRNLRPRVFVKAKLTINSLKKLESLCEIYQCPDINADELCNIIGNFDAIICHGPERFYTDKFFKCARKLKILARTSVGTDMVDIEAATNYGVIVTNTPGANAISVAEEAILLILALSRKLILCDHKVRSGEPFRRADIYQMLQGVEIYKKQMGVVGYGSVGRELAKRAVSMGLNVNAFDPMVTHKSMKNEGVNFMSFNDLLLFSDYLILCCPLNDQTKGIINKGTLKQMKRQAYLVNIARGGLVISEDLYEALKMKQIAGAAIDVTEPEPPLSNDPLLSLDNVIFSAHQGGNTNECWERMCDTAVECVLKFFSGKRPDNIIRKNQ